MPAPVTSSSARIASRIPTLKPRTHGNAKKTRMVRRRGRAKDAMESDDDFEREVRTDSESDPEDLSSLDSASDSDTEPASEDVVPNGHSRALTPSTSQSPGDSRPLDKDLNSVTPFFNSAATWSEMVADETANGPADLPVIEFAEFDGQAFTQSAHRSTKAPKPAKSSLVVGETTLLPSSSPSPLPAEEEKETEPVASTSHHSPHPSHPRRPPGQTARQAYQQRLESDPSYIPTVGGFWGHDDRLLDKDLRSLSGWWRGRWQGGGRGFLMRGRGRGGFFGSGSGSNHGSEDAEADLPPIERAWTHDGFEEMKQKEEQRRTATKAQPEVAQLLRGVTGFRGGRGFAAGRGGRGGFVRGGFTASTGTRSDSTFLPPGRIWFAMKPELMWTKQHDAFLHFDSSLKPRQGQGPAFRVKLPGSRTQLVRSLHKPHPLPTVSKVAILGSPHSNYGEKCVTVRLPGRPGNEKQNEVLVPLENTPIEDIFTVRPRLVERKPIPLPEPPVSPTASPTINGANKSLNHPPEAPQSPPPPVKLPPASSQPLPGPSIISQLGQLSLEPQTSDPVRQAQTEQAVLRKPSTETLPELEQQDGSRESEQRPPLPPLQTVFTTPLSQPSPVYGSSYTYGHALPTGVVLNHLGVPYELATGRPVYLQPPPPVMYNPRPLMHSQMPPPGMTFVPGHMHHHSAVSPDFLAHPTPHTPAMNGFIDPATGTPIFSFPRQTSRIEIRAPADNSEVKPPSKSSTRGSSGLRTTATTFEPSHATDQGIFPSLTTPPDPNNLSSYASVDVTDGGSSVDDVHVRHHQAMLPYPAYQPYYYPEAYGYPPYMDMSQIGQYEMYPPDPLVPHGTIYY